MSTLDRINAWCLGIAARRWPEELRDDLRREWQAELEALAGEPRGGWRRLHFAASLAASPPVTDENGVPLGWRENTATLAPTMAPSMALVVAGLLAVAVASLGHRLIDFLLGLTGLSFVDPLYDRIDETLFAIPPVLFCLAAGWWIGSRVPMGAAREGRFGRAGSAAYAPVPVAVALVIGALSGGGGLLLLLSLAVAVLVWVPATSALGVAAARRGLGGHRRQAAAAVLVGTPVIIVLTVLAALVPAALGVDAGFAAGLRAAADFLPGQVTDFAVLDRAMTDDALTTVQSAARLPMVLLPYTLLALAYGLSAARRRDATAAATATVETPVADRPALRPTLVAVGTACLAVAVCGWAYTVAVLTPAMPRVSERAPMPGGDGEIYLWVAELRWAAILLAVLGLLATAARRRSPLKAATALGVLLLGVDATLERTGAGGAGGLQIALAAGTVAAGAAWLIAGAPAPRTAAEDLRTGNRLAAVAMIAALCGPLLYAQGTPAVNHPFLPVGLALTTAAVTVLFVVLATVSALEVRRRPLPAAASAALVGVPALALAGLGVFLGNGVDEGLAAIGVLLALPLAVVLYAVMRRHRQGRRAPTAALWTGLTVLAAPLTIAFAYLAMMPGMFVPIFLFALAGTGYPADGLSLVPGALLVALPIAAWVGASLSRHVAAAVTGGRAPAGGDVPAGDGVPAGGDVPAGGGVPADGMQRPGGFVPGLAD
jgi:hypothetical protein